MTQEPPKLRSSFDIVPEIDLEPLLAGTVKGMEQVAAQIFQAYTTVGFAYVTNHQIPQSLINNIFTASANFHALPREEKLSIEVNTTTGDLFQLTLRLRVRRVLPRQQNRIRVNPL